MAFCAHRSSISLDMCIKFLEVLEKIKTYLFLSHVAHSLHHNSWLQLSSYESWENFLLDRHGKLSV